jgi:hypothetical protein
MQSLKLLDFKLVGKIIKSSANSRFNILADLVELCSFVHVYVQPKLLCYQVRQHLEAATRWQKILKIMLHRQII